MSDEWTNGRKKHEYYQIFLSSSFFNVSFHSLSCYKWHQFAWNWMPNFHSVLFFLLSNKLNYYICPNHLPMAKPRMAFSECVSMCAQNWIKYHYIIIRSFKSSSISLFYIQTGNFFPPLRFFCQLLRIQVNSSFENETKMDKKRKKRRMNAHIFHLVLVTSLFSLLVIWKIDKNGVIFCGFSEYPISLFNWKFPSFKKNINADAISMQTQEKCSQSFGFSFREFLSPSTMFNGDWKMISFICVVQWKKVHSIHINCNQFAISIIFRNAHKNLSTQWNHSTFRLCCLFRVVIFCWHILMIDWFMVFIALARAYLFIKTWACDRSAVKMFDIIHDFSIENWFVDDVEILNSCRSIGRHSHFFIVHLS